MVFLVAGLAGQGGARRGWAKMMQDPRLQARANPMRFDGKRLIYGGFEVALEFERKAGLSPRPRGFALSFAGRIGYVVRQIRAGTQPGRRGNLREDMMTRKTPDQLRSARWFEPDDFRSFGHRSRMNQMGYAGVEYRGKPVIAIINTWSDLNMCHAHFKTRVDDVRRGILQAGGFPVVASGDLAVGEQGEAHHHALPQLPRHGDRGADPLAPGRRRGADGRLRQDHAGPDPRRDQRWRSRDLHAGRPHAARQLAGQGAGLGLRRLQVLGRAARRHDHRQGLVGDGGRHRAQLRRVHDHGHGLDHDGPRRHAGHDAAGRLVHSGRRRQPYPHGLRLRAAHRRDGLGGPDPGEDPDARGLSERAAPRHGDGLLDQRGDPHHRHGAPRGHASRSTTSTPPAARFR